MDKDHSEENGKMAAALAVVEVGLGSFLHSFKIPLSGHILSINQMAMIARASFRLKEKKSALEISLVASLLKSLSPAGKKLTPMLAIATQGLLFYLGLSLAGLNLVGLFFATFFASAWAFLQPVLFIYLLFGQTSVEVVAYFLKEMQKVTSQAEGILIYILLGLFVLKLLLAFGFSLFAIKAKEETFQKFKEKMTREIKPREKKTYSHPALQAMRDLFNPLFIVSLSLTMFYFIYSEASFVRIIWELLRPIAVGFILFYFFRMYPLEKISLYFEKKGFSQLSRSLNKAIIALKEIKFLK